MHSPIFTIAGTLSQFNEIQYKTRHAIKTTFVRLKLFIFFVEAVKRNINELENITGLVFPP